METIRLHEVTYTREAIERRLENHKATLIGLRNKQITPRTIVGTGYKNGREAAEIYLHEQIARYQTIITVMEGN